MLTRLVSLLLVLLAAPVLAQQPNIQTRINQRIDRREQQISQVVTMPGPDLKAARLEALHHDAGELSALSASVQSDLLQLQKGMLAKDLNANLKKMEKLSKKLRQEIE